MKRTLSIPEWHALAEEGTALPVRITLMGSSMFPLVRFNKDYVTIMPVTEKPQPGDIVLFPDHVRDLYVVHRVWRIEDGRVQTWGDNCPGPDEWVPLDDVWGKTVLIERGKRVIYPNPAKGLRWAKFWHQAGKGYRVYRKYKDRYNERFKK